MSAAFKRSVVVVVIDEKKRKEKSRRRNRKNSTRRLYELGGGALMDILHRRLADSDLMDSRADSLVTSLGGEKRRIRTDRWILFQRKEKRLVPITSASEASLTACFQGCFQFSFSALILSTRFSTFFHKFPKFFQSLSFSFTLSSLLAFLPFPSLR